jgi:hypothetical protein
MIKPATKPIEMQMNTSNGVLEWWSVSDKKIMKLPKSHFAIM